MFWWISGYLFVAIIAGLIVRFLSIKLYAGDDIEPLSYFTAAFWPFMLPFVLIGFFLKYFPDWVLEKWHLNKIRREAEAEAAAKAAEVAEANMKLNLLREADKVLSLDITDGDYRTAPECNSCGQRVTNYE